jgi:type IV fimbrial biogenesis protein FimT
MTGARAPISGPGPATAHPGHSRIPATCEEGTRKFRTLRADDSLRSLVSSRDDFASPGQSAEFPDGEATTRRNQRGVSLIEAMLATAIAGVLTSAALPAMTEAMTQQRLRAGNSDLFATFNLARSEAIRRGGPVAVTPADARDWSSGWKVFADSNDNGVHDAGEDTVLERPAAAGGVTIRPYFGATFSGRVLSYTGEGRLHRPGGQGLVIGRLVLTQHGAARSLCFASLGVRMVAAAVCD